MKAYKIKWEMNNEDLFANNPIGNPSFNGVAIIISILAAAVVFLDLESVSTFTKVLISSMFIPLFYGVLYGVAFLIVRIAAWRRKSPLPVMDLLIDEVGIHGEQSTVSSFLLKWERIQSIKENKKYLIIRTRKKERIAIPKRYFATQADLTEVLSFMRECAGGNDE